MVANRAAAAGRSASSAGEERLAQVQPQRPGSPRGGVVEMPAELRLVPVQPLRHAEVLAALAGEEEERLRAARGPRPGARAQRRRGAVGVPGDGEPAVGVVRTAGLERPCHVGEVRAGPALQAVGEPPRLLVGRRRGPRGDHQQLVTGGRGEGEGAHRRRRGSLGGDTARGPQAVEKGAEGGAEPVRRTGGDAVPVRRPFHERHRWSSEVPVRRGGRCHRGHGRR
ncbi:hypothetical protein GCM10020221_35260 [Streptomyces thioluteus]|uniref:Uncharacterized protein n=1 Tax=Streptomyces thioluteus TaxID=66431 RepID=A0ABN3X5Q7_STRTU